MVQSLRSANAGEGIEVVLPIRAFTSSSGGQVSDTELSSVSDRDGRFAWQDIRKPAAGMVVHVGQVTRGSTGW